MKKFIIFFFLLITTVVAIGQTKKHYFFVYEYYGNDRTTVVLDSISRDTIKDMPKKIKKAQKKFVDAYYTYKKSKKTISNKPTIQKTFDQNMEVLITLITDYLPYRLVVMNNEGLDEEMCYYIGKFTSLLKFGPGSEIDTPLFYERMDLWYNNLDIILAYYLTK